VSVLLCRDSRHFYSAVSASEDFFDFALVMMIDDDVSMVADTAASQLDVWNVGM